MLELARLRKLDLIPKYLIPHDRNPLYYGSLARFICMINQSFSLMSDLVGGPNEGERTRIIASQTKPTCGMTIRVTATCKRHL